MRAIKFSICAMFVATSGFVISAFAQNQPPNIIVILTDDQGYADIGALGISGDVRTPSIDQLAREGVLITSGYVTAPQCVPSRAALITGRYQQTFGVDGNATGPLDQKTMADHLRDAGYATGIVGKWHLSPTRKQIGWIVENVPQPWTYNDSGQIVIPAIYRAPYHPFNRGFSEYFLGETTRFDANFALDGSSLPVGSTVYDDRTKIEIQSDAAIAFLSRNHQRPFFLYLAYSGVHVPLDAPDSYLALFPNTDTDRRQYALAMLAQIDDGVGKIIEKLEQYAIDRQTLIIFLSDNGAPYAISKEDLPVSDPSGVWNGSLNDPWIGEKGMLTEGGVRVPFLLWWPGRIPEGLQYNFPVISLDIAATSYAQAGLKVEDLDGVDLIPALRRMPPTPVHDYLFWRWDGQLAIRNERFKYIALEDGTDYLFDLQSSSHEFDNLVRNDPKLANTLWRRAWGWAQSLTRQDFPTTLNRFWRGYFEHYLGEVLPEESRAAAIEQAMRPAKEGG